MAAQTARPRVPIPWPSTARAGALLVLALLALVGAGALGVSSALAQTAGTPYLDFRTQLRPTPTPKGPGLGSVANGVSKDAKMLVQADELDYDYNNQRVSAIGNVRMYYQGATIEADRVIYDQRAKRLHAEGNARLTDADGKISYGEVIDLSDDYRDGFVDSLRVETPDQTRIAAARAERSEGKNTRDSIVEASTLRFRPILMTTMAALFGAVPLAIGTGMGSELRRPMGISIIGGLIVSQALTLYTTPVIYLFMDNMRMRFSRRPAL